MINIVQFGFGNIGMKLFELAKEFESIKYVAAAEINGGIVNPNGLTNQDINNLKNNTSVIPELNSFNLIEKVHEQGVKDCVVVDVTASNKMVETLVKAQELGYKVVLSNKKPISGKLQDFNKLYNDKLGFECTVGAGLPIIYTLKSLLNTGDEIKEINGCFSGTLGYVFTELEKGHKFSEIIKKAKELGYTEPDPRDDLSGLDVARKALILARLCGHNLEIEDVEIENLVPNELLACSIEDFLEKLGQYDDEFSQKYEEASEVGHTLRYVASILNGKLQICLKQVAKNSKIGSLKGPDNICVIRSKRYSENHLVIEGPGAGLEVTAAGVLRNILEVGKC